MGKTGPVYYLVSGPLVLCSGLHGTVDVRHAEHAGGVPDHPARAPAIARARRRARHAAGGRSRPARAGAADREGQQEGRSRRRTVAYQGDPKFEPIEKTKLEHAVNTDKQIIKFGDLYYLCFQGVWFMSKSATGPWEVATSIPKEIYEIPASSPAHNVTYVTVSKTTMTRRVGDVRGRRGLHGRDGRLGLRGVGHRLVLPALLGLGRLLPLLLPALSELRLRRVVQPVERRGYGRTAVAYGPYGGAGVSARYNPTTGTYSRGAAAWGPYGARGAGQAYNPRTGTYAQTRQGSNVYGSWGSTSVQRGDQWAQTARVTNNRTGTTTRVTQGSGGGEAISRNTPGPGGSTVARTGQRRRLRRPRRQRLQEVGRQLAEVRRERQLEQRGPAGDGRGQRHRRRHRRATAPPPAAAQRRARVRRRPTAPARPARESAPWTAGRSTSSTATRGRAPKGRSARATTATVRSSRRHAPRARRAATGRAAAACAPAAADGGDRSRHDLLRVGAPREPRARDLPDARRGLRDRADSHRLVQPGQRRRHAAGRCRHRPARHQGGSRSSKWSSSTCSCSRPATRSGRSSSAASRRTPGRRWR